MTITAQHETAENLDEMLKAGMESGAMETMDRFAALVVEKMRRGA